MDKLYLCPTDAYSVQGPQDDVLRSGGTGGAGRYRADVIGGSSTANVTFSLRPDSYQYLWAFFRAKTDHGATPFLIDLNLDGGPRQERTVHFLPGTLAMTGKTLDRFFTATAQLEVHALDDDSDYDNSVVDVYVAYGGDALEIFNLLNIVVNVNWPIAP